MSRQKRLLTAALALALALSLTACGAEQVELEDGQTVSSSVEELTIQLQSGEIGKLDEFPDLKSVDLSGSTCYDEILDWSARHPEVAVRYTVTLPDGTAVSNGETRLDLSAMSDEQKLETARLLPWLPQVDTLLLGSVSQGAVVDQLQQLWQELGRGSDHPLNLEYTPIYQGRELDMTVSALDLSQTDGADARELLRWMPQMTQLKSVELGTGDGENSRIPWETIYAMEQAAPQARFDYRFTLYGKDVDLHDASLDLNHIRLEDQGALVKSIVVCMPELTYLDMDFCNVDDEYMAQIRDALPAAEVVWRVWFGTGYSVRTDVERILASNPGMGGDLTYANTRSLCYCTKVKYLDLGHNHNLDTIDFVAYMPELEVLVAAINCWTDESPLANLQNLRHLNVCNDSALRDISPLEGLENLERLWIGVNTPINPEQIEAFRESHPNCNVNDTDMDPTREGWRWIGTREDGWGIPDPRYELLRVQMGYDEAPWSYAYIGNDPLYLPHGQGNNTLPPAWFNAQFGG